jgi:membrane peptidoglycan carboxypeptidase
VQRPTDNDPRENLKQATDRFEYVADQMLTNGYVTKAERQKMALPETRPSKAWRKDSRLTPEQYMVQMRVIDELSEQGLDQGTLSRGGYTVRTTLDKKAQGAAIKAIETQKENLPDTVKSSLVAVAPGTGEVKAYYGDGQVGGYNWVDAPQEPGSSFKPFVALAGLHKGRGLGETYDGSSPQEIAGTEFANAPGVECDDPQRCGVREAMTKSVNTVFVNMAAQLGPPNIAEAAYNAGVPRDYGGGPTLQSPDGLVHSGIALGMYKVKPIDMASAYGTLAAQGKHFEPHIVDSATSRDGQTVRYHQEEPTTLYDESASMANKLAFNTLSSMLEVADHAKIGLDRPVLSKTGTHQFRDTKKNQNAWMIGSTPQLSAAVAMMGTENQMPAALEDNSGVSFYGSKYPGSAWQEFMRIYHEDKPVEQFKKADPIGRFKKAPPPPPPTSSEPPTSETMPSETSEQPPTSSTRPGNGNGNGSDDCGGLFQPPCDQESSQEEPTSTESVPDQFGRDPEDEGGWGN